MTDPEEGSSGLPLSGEFVSDCRLRRLIQHADAGARIDHKVQILGAVFATTDGSVEGLEIALEWSARWEDDPGPKIIRRLWDEWKKQPPEESFKTLAKHLASRGFDWRTLDEDSDGENQVPDMAEVDSAPTKATRPAPKLLLRLSMIDELPQLKADALSQKPFCSGLALFGEANVWYAEPNTGKTVMALRLLRDDIESGKVDPSLVFYFNLDDSRQGLIEKTQIAKELGFHVVAEGYKGFRSKDFPELIQQLVDMNQCEGVLIFLDTLKKFTDIMDKGKSSFFGKLIRTFVLRGGTCIALAHTNKRRNHDGEPIYAGTSDILEDFDCAYLVYETNIDPDSETKTILFKNKKSRGNVRKAVSFQYSIADGLSYLELLDSIAEVSETVSLERQYQSQLSADRQYIEIVRDGIRSGTDTKMAMVANLVNRSNCRKREAIRLIERYEGNDPSAHYWNFRVGPRGAKIYYLLVP